MITKNDINLFETVEDFAPIIYPNSNEGIFYRFQYEVGSIFDLKRLLNSRFNLNDNPVGSIEFLSLYGDMKLSSYCKRLIKQFGIIKTSSNIYIPSSKCITHLSDYLWVKYHNKWGKLDELNNSKYDALSPFNISLTENNNDSFNETKTNSFTRSNNRTSTKTEQGNDNSSNNITNNRYAFNSPNTTNVDGSQSDNKNTYSNTGSDTITDKNDESGTDKRNSNNTKERSYIRKGNMGNASYAKLINEEREVLNYKIVDIVLQDIACELSDGIW